MSENVNITLPPYALRAIEVLENAGFEAWCVGGCVRDNILGRPVNDYDIATNARWQETQRAFEALSYPTFEVGVKHGTLTVLVDDQPLEITTYRTDGTYSDSRHPDSVQFVSSIEDDLARRDFTINALAWHPTRGLMDCHGGLEDLRSKQIRAVGDPFTRFSEDALRILRACRFAAQLGFSIEPATYAAMNKRKTLMLKVSAERITHELTALLCGEYAPQALVETFDVLCAVMPELAAMKGFEQHTPHHIYDVLVHTAHVVENVPPTPLLRWSALLHDAGKPAAFFQEEGVGHFFGHANVSVNIVHDITKRLCLSPSLVADITTLVRIHDVMIAANPRSVKRALLKLDGRADLFRALCQLKKADALSQAPSSAPRVQLADDLLRVLDEVLAAGDAYSLKDLQVNGKDVMSLGVDAGPRVGELLEAALDAVINEQVANDHDVLMAWLETQLS